VIEEKGGTTADELTNVLDMDRDKADADIQAGGNGILDAPTPGFGRKDATSPMLKIGIGVCR